MFEFGLIAHRVLRILVIFWHRFNNKRALQFLLLGKYLFPDLVIFFRDISAFDMPLELGVR